MASVSYLIPENKVAHEMMDGEVIVIHFATGSYFSLNDAAASIWQWITAGADHEQIAASFENLTAEQAREIDAFLEQLVAKGILEKSLAPSSVSFSAPRIPYRRPVVESYDDMRSLLLVDPIHDVDETGWPRPMEG